MRGDRPRTLRALDRELESAPHARGSTHLEGYRRSARGVRPACAGIDPSSITIGSTRSSPPRMRGDRPGSERPSTANTRSAPHARGSTRRYASEAVVVVVRPACAGIDPGAASPLFGVQCPPRMRGDRPARAEITRYLPRSAPHARGSTRAHAQRVHRGFVRPARAGIDPRAPAVVARRPGPPRTRGDRPKGLGPRYHHSTSAPHARGSTVRDQSALALAAVRPARAGIDPAPSSRRGQARCPPRTRGDRPARGLSDLITCASAPHARGSTPDDAGTHCAHCVRPARARIDPRIQASKRSVLCPPRTRGDRPVQAIFFGLLVVSAPHARGSTHVPLEPTAAPRVRPARAGIDHR